GVSYFSIVRAAWADVTRRRIAQGGSTITQQYVKNVYTGNQRTFGRKIKEAILAVKVDHRYSKDEILGRYLNTVYFGNGAYGVQAHPPASHRAAYFVSIVSKALQDTYGYEETFTGGLRVTTTLDSKMQHAAEQAIAAHLPGSADPSAALVSIDPKTGAILALVG